MDEYKAAYLRLFNGINDIIETLKSLQFQSEDIILNASDTKTALELVEDNGE